MQAEIDLDRSLDELEKTDWGEPGYDSHLVVTCHRLRKKPLKDFTVEDLRIMIGQNISLDLLMPLALERLQQNIMAEGDCYPGDLLNNVLSADPSYWVKNPVKYRKLYKLYKNNFLSIERRVDKSITRGIFKAIKESFKEFENIKLETAEE